MNNIEFIKKDLFVNKGIYNNKKIFEDTLESFKEAIIIKKGIIFKLWETKDKKIIAFNDSNLTRLLNLKDKIEDTTYEELSFLAAFHIPTLEEVLKLINNQVPLIINPECNFIFKDYLKNMANILDNYQGDFALVSENPCIIKWINANRPNFNVGEIITKRKFQGLSKIIANYSIKTNFKLYNIDYYDEIKVQTLRKETTVIGYLIKTKKELETYQDSFDNLIIDNYNQIALTK